MNRPRRLGTPLLFALIAAPFAAPAEAQIIQRLENRAQNAAVPANPASALFPAAPGTVVQQGTVIQPGTVVQVGPATTTTVAPAATIGSHQIDRFEAIRQLQADLASDANNVANWTILGELAHEVALDVPQGQDDTYYTMSRQAYEKAAALEPTNPGLKAALQFARDQETNAATFDAKRRQGVSTYLDARRREMAAAGVNPTILTYESPVNPATTTVTTPGQPGVATQAYGTTYPTATYRPYYNPQAQQAYGYNQYSNGLTPATATGTQAAPMTLRQYGQQLPGVLLNQGVRSFGR